MAGIPSEHAHDVRQALRVIVSDPALGAATLSSPQALSNLLKDLLPDAPREKNLLVAAAEANLAGQLSDSYAQGIDAQSAIRLAAASLAASTHFTEGVCTWAATELAVALGLVPEASYGTSDLPAQEGEAVRDGAPADAVPVSPEPVRPMPVSPVPVSPELVSPELVSPEPAAGDATVYAQTRLASDVHGGDRTEAPSDLGSATSAASAPARRTSLGAIVLLAGLVLAVAGYVLPVFHDRYYYYDVGILRLTQRLVEAAWVSLVGAGLCTAGVALLRRASMLRTVASAGACASGILMGVVFVRVYTTYVSSGGDDLRPGLVVGLAGAVLLTVGGIAALLRYRSDAQAARQATSR